MRKQVNRTEKNVLETLAGAAQPRPFRQLVERVRLEHQRPGYSEASIRVALAALGKAGLAGWAIKPAGLHLLRELRREDT